MGYFDTLCAARDKVIVERGRMLQLFDLAMMHELRMRPYDEELIKAALAHLEEVTAVTKHINDRGDALREQYHGENTK